MAEFDFAQVNDFSLLDGGGNQVFRVVSADRLRGKGKCIVSTYCTAAVLICPYRGGSVAA